MTWLTAVQSATGISHVQPGQSVVRWSEFVSPASVRLTNERTIHILQRQARGRSKLLGTREEEKGVSTIWTTRFIGQPELDTQLLTLPD